MSKSLSVQAVTRNDNINFVHWILSLIKFHLVMEILIWCFETVLKVSNQFLQKRYSKYLFACFNMNLNFNLQLKSLKSMSLVAAVCSN